MRKDAHHQLLSFISMNETWEDSLRTNTLDVYPPSSSSSKRKEKRSHLSSSKHQQKSPYSTPVIRNPRGVRRSKSMSSLKF